MFAYLSKNSKSIHHLPGLFYDDVIIFLNTYCTTSALYLSFMYWFTFITPLSVFLKHFLSFHDSFFLGGGDCWFGLHPMMLGIISICSAFTPGCAQWIIQDTGDLTGLAACKVRALYTVLIIYGYSSLSCHLNCSGAHCHFPLWVSISITLLPQFL